MIPTSIGLPTERKGDPAYDGIQEWLCEHGLTPYMPQLRYGRTYNLGMGYDRETHGMHGAESPYGWTGSMIDETARFQEPMIFLYGDYWYNSRPDVLRWGDGLTVDGCSLGQLTDYLGNTLRWFRSHGMGEAWIGVDEPPHHPIYGWTQELEDRVVKFIQAATAGGWTVGVCHPNPTAYEFWKSRIKPKRWILNDRAAAAEYGEVSGEVWLYNAPAAAGLAGRLKAIGATGYLTWSATEAMDVEALFGMSGNAFWPTPAMTTLLAELALVEAPPVEPPVEPDTGIADQLDAIVAAVAKLRMMLELPRT